MKVKMISRSTDDFTRERSQDLQKVFRNYDPNIRSQERGVEYTRALNAAKLEKIFARPFVGAMDGHIDAVSCMAKNPNHLKGIFSGSMDGDIRLWDLANRRTVCQFPGHQGAVRGLTVSTDGQTLVSCGTDCTVRLWNVPDYRSKSSGDSAGNAVVPIAVYVWKHAFWGVDHQWGGNLFATVGAQVDIWDHDRSEPVNTFKWGNDTVMAVRFNPGEPDLFATSSSDRSIILFDLRMSSPARKLIMKTRCNSLSWNPREPMNFTAVSMPCFPHDAFFLFKRFCFLARQFRALRGMNFFLHAFKIVVAVRLIFLLHDIIENLNFLFLQTYVDATQNTSLTLKANEDTNCYSYDARKLDEAKCVHGDHVSAVMDVDYSPTGREFVTGSYDRTVRIFNYNGDHSKEIYHTKRMQRVFCVKYSCDGTYVISGSDDTNLRLWKAKASEQLGVLLPRERRKQEYLDAVKDRYKHLPEVKRIVRHRHLPKPIYKAATLRRTMIEAERRKDQRRRAHSAPGSMPVKPFRKRRIIKEEE